MPCFRRRFARKNMAAVCSSISLFMSALRAFYMIQLPDVDKSVWGLGLMTYLKSKYNSYSTEYEHNKKETER